MGSLQRADDDVFARIGVFFSSATAGTWAAWKRLTFEYDGLRYVGSFAPLFVHQYSQAWFDFRGKRDKYADYFANSAIATDAHRLFCLELAKQFPDYSDDLWGITASDSEKGYVIWGGPPEVGPIDGTVVPSASAGSLPFLPQPVMRVLRTMKSRYPAAWSKYGFVNSFNPLKNWYDGDVVGIDTGITMLMARDARSGFVWNTFMQNRRRSAAWSALGSKRISPRLGDAASERSCFSSNRRNFASCFDRCFAPRLPKADRSEDSIQFPTD